MTIPNAQNVPLSSNLTIRQLEVFAMASRSSTFSEAARRLGISQPTLSNTVAKIEEQLGMRLFDRTTRSMVLTVQGERLAVVAEELVRNFQASLQHIQDAANESRGRMSLAVTPSVATALAPAALNLFYETYPEFEVVLHDIAGDRALALVLDRVVDFAIMATPAAAALLHIEPLLMDEYQLICRQDHPLAAKRSVSWTDIAATSLILAGTPAIYRDIEHAWQRNEVEIRPRFKVEQLMTGLAMVAGGLGVAILPGLFRPAGIYANLVSVPMGRARIEREISIVRRSDRGISRPVQHMLDCFLQGVAKR
ncbi:MAG: LysR family transcriptional regulator [Pseudomonadota bacterium]